MNARKAIQIGCALALGLAMYMPTARADVRDQEARLNFSKPVQVSDTVTLSAGTYTLRMADMTNYPNNVIHIFDESGNFITNVATEVTYDKTGLTQPLRVVGDPQYGDWTHARLQFAEGPDRDILVKYFYGGEPAGHKFVYSRQMENEISEQPMVNVIVMPQDRAAPEPLAANNNQ